MAADTTHLDLFEAIAEFNAESPSAASLEEMIRAARLVHRDRLAQLRALRLDVIATHRSFANEVSSLRKFSEYLNGQPTPQGIWAGSEAGLSPWPSLKNVAISPRSVGALLDHQAQLSARHIEDRRKSADALEAGEQELRTACDRVDSTMVQVGAHAAAAAKFARDFKRLTEEMDEGTEPDARAAQRQQARAQLDAQLENSELCSAMEGRLAELKRATERLADIMMRLSREFRQYTAAASSSLEGVAGRAMLSIPELRQGIDAMRNSLSVTTEFLAETQAFFRAHLGDDLQMT